MKQIFNFALFCRYKTISAHFNRQDCHHQMKLQHWPSGLNSLLTSSRRSTILSSSRLYA